MKFIIHFVFLGSILYAQIFTVAPSRQPIKIQLSELSEIYGLVELGIKADGFIKDETEWITHLTSQEIRLLEANGVNFSVPNKVELNEATSALIGEIQTTFDDCGYQLKVAYNQYQKVSGIHIQVFDLAGKSFGQKLGYNNPPNYYDCSFNAYNWPTGIYLVQLAINQKGKIQKIVPKNPLTKKT